MKFVTYFIELFDNFSLIEHDNVDLNALLNFWRMRLWFSSKKRIAKNR